MVVRGETHRPEALGYKVFARGARRQLRARQLERYAWVLARPFGMHHSPERLIDSGQTAIASACGPTESPPWILVRSQTTMRTIPSLPTARSIVWVIAERWSPWIPGTLERANSCREQASVWIEAGVRRWDPVGQTLSSPRLQNVPPVTRFERFEVRCLVLTLYTCW